MEHGEIIERLKRLDSCAVSDALDKLGLRGAVGGLDRRSSTQRVAGRVLTVKLVPAAQVIQNDRPPRHLGTTAIELSNPGDIIVVEQRSRIDAGSWGGILTLGAKLRGVQAVIADGPVRDIDEARQYDFPVFSRGTTAVTARGRVAEADTNVAIRVGDVDVHPGDYVIADGSGVVFIASAHAARVLPVAEQIAAREAQMANALLRGVAISQVMGADYEHMLTK